MSFQAECHRIAAMPVWWTQSSPKNWHEARDVEPSKQYPITTIAEENLLCSKMSEKEYFAEGVQSYLGVNVKRKGADGVHNGSKQELKKSLNAEELLTEVTSNVSCSDKSAMCRKFASQLMWCDKKWVALACKRSCNMCKNPRNFKHALKKVNSENHVKTEANFAGLWQEMVNASIRKERLWLFAQEVAISVLSVDILTEDELTEGVTEIFT
ncbi:hypothetical protein GQR58_029419 [Nymphon striatum]|nr:hypothetical protein GQR58_029419 [Nymphon striatum]